MFACIRAKTEEFISPKRVKIETINTETKATCELYQGKK
jgi:hypothetical protein